MSDIGILVCRGLGCNAELGKVINIKFSEDIKKIGSWDINKVRLKGEFNKFPCQLLHNSV